MRRVQPSVRFEFEELRRRLQEAEETLEAIRSGEVDALVVSGPAGERVFTLSGAEHPYRIMVETMNEGALSLSLDGSILYSNHAFAQILQRPLDTIIGHSLSEFVATNQRGAFEDLLSRGGAQAARGELELATPDGIVPTQFSLSPVRMDNQTVVSVVVTDLTQRVREREAREAIRLRDDFISIASHELRTPLSTLGLSLNLLERLTSKTDESAGKIAHRDPDLLPETVRKARNQAARMTDLINRLLDVSSLASGQLGLELAPHDLGAITRDVLDLLAEQAVRADCKIEVHIDGEIPVDCDRSRLEQAIVNVIANATKYGPGAPIIVHVRREGQQAVLQIDDHGVGIKEEDLERIFNRFERAGASSRAAGLGLGLYISRGVVRQHGGSIRAERRHGGGSRFVITLPLAVERQSLRG